MFIVYVFRNDEMITRADCHDMKQAIEKMKNTVEVWCEKPGYRVTVTHEKNSN